jgi:predicted enzyme related to lactoylglutathione lyase
MSVGIARTVAMILLKQHDLPAAISFYQQLGLRLIFHLKDKWAELELNGIKIGLFPAPEQASQVRTGVVFAVDDLAHIYEHQKDTLCFLGEPKRAIHGIMVSVKDPGGNIIDLYQKTPEKIHELLEKCMKEDSCCKSAQIQCKCN